MVEIKYNSGTIAEVDGGQIATLKCKDKEMMDDVIISGASEVAYNGEVLATISEGQTVTLRCKDKQMIDDISVTALETMATLTAPSIEIDGTTLNIYDEEGLATSYDILVDGVVKDSVSAVSLISFTIEAYDYGGTTLTRTYTCQAEEGMTWSDWCESVYYDTTTALYINGEYVKQQGDCVFNSDNGTADNILSTDVITANATYYLRSRMRE